MEECDYERRADDVHNLLLNIIPFEPAQAAQRFPIGGDRAQRVAEAYDPDTQERNLVFDLFRGGLVMTMRNWLDHIDNVADVRTMTAADWFRVSFLAAEEAYAGVLNLSEVDGYVLYETRHLIKFCRDWQAKLDSVGDPMGEDGLPGERLVHSDGCSAEYIRYICVFANAWAFNLCVVHPMLAAATKRDMELRDFQIKALRKEARDAKTRVKRAAHETQEQKLAGDRAMATLQKEMTRIADQLSDTELQAKRKEETERRRTGIRNEIGKLGIENPRNPVSKWEKDAKALMASNVQNGEADQAVAKRAFADALTQRHGNVMAINSREGDGKNVTDWNNSLAGLKNMSVPNKSAAGGTGFLPGTHTAIEHHVYLFRGAADDVFKPIRLSFLQAVGLYAAMNGPFRDHAKLN